MSRIEQVLADDREFESARKGNANPQVGRLVGRDGKGSAGAHVSVHGKHRVMLVRCVS
jgi:hypothetical protein